MLGESPQRQAKQNHDIGKTGGCWEDGDGEMEPPVFVQPPWLTVLWSRKILNAVTLSVVWSLSVFPEAPCAGSSGRCVARSGGGGHSGR